MNIHFSSYLKMGLNYYIYTFQILLEIFGAMKKFATFAVRSEKIIT